MFKIWRCKCSSWECEMQLSIVIFTFYRPQTRILRAVRQQYIW